MDRPKGNWYQEGRLGWRNRDLWKAAKEYGKSGKRGVENFSKRIKNLSFSYIESELEDVMKTDLRYPIVIFSNGELLDGYHRLAKAKFLGKKWIRVKILNRMPKPTWTKL